uniref:Uncharacterized protein n=1 Tax=Timema genevievae TaxID=629358 RepID=A0A7R9PS64_TIMGE|nr:unnamed protein product [Timema genevievae]
MEKAPFFVSLDHVTQSVVVTIRGSISLRDLFTDFTAGADRFDVEGLPPDTMAHKGMIIGANNIKACLDEQKILEKAFTMYPEYNLVISGNVVLATTRVACDIK